MDNNLVNNIDSNVQQVNPNSQVSKDQRPSIIPVALIVWLLSAPVIYLELIVSSKSSEVAGWMMLLGWVVVIFAQIGHAIFLTLSLLISSTIPWKYKYTLLPTIAAAVSFGLSLLLKNQTIASAVSSFAVGATILVISSIFIAIIYHFILIKKYKKTNPQEYFRFDSAKSYLILILLLILPVISFFQSEASSKNVASKESKLNRSIIIQGDVPSNCEVLKSNYTNDGMSSPKVSQLVKCVPLGENVNNVILFNNIEIEYNPGHQQFNDHFRNHKGCANYPINQTIIESKICLDQFRESYASWIQGDYEFVINGSFGQNSTGWAGQDMVKLQELTKSIVKIVAEKNSDLY